MRNRRTDTAEPAGHDRARRERDPADTWRELVGQYGTNHPIATTGGRALALQPTATASTAAPVDRTASAGSAGGIRAWLHRHRAVVSDVVAMLVAALDVSMAIPVDAHLSTSWPPTTDTWSLILSVVAVLALSFRRRLPFVATLVAMPGFLAGWSELGAMIALGTLAWQRGRSRSLIVAGIGVWTCRFVAWPLSDFAAEGWRRHVQDGIYGCFVVGMPIAIGMLVTARHDLSARIRELAASREREQRLQAIAIRADERAKIAREMHDVVSHQVSLIAMQAGALQVATREDLARETAATIRGLSTRTLDELRNLVGALRTATDGADEPDLDTLLDLVRDSAVDVRLDLDLNGRRAPGPVASAAYRTVQEALTNVRKHAADAPTTVAITVADGGLLVLVENEPPAAVAGSREHARPAGGLPSGGHGLLGLSERAALLGGQFTAGPTRLGGFAVRAHFPLPPE